MKAFPIPMGAQAVTFVNIGDFGAGYRDRPGCRHHATMLDLLVFFGLGITRFLKCPGCA